MKEVSASETGALAAVWQRIFDALTLSVIRHCYTMLQIWSVAGGVLQPVFQGWRLTSNYEAVKARFEQAVAQYQRSAQERISGSRRTHSSASKNSRASRLELEVSVRAVGRAATDSRAFTTMTHGLANYL